MKLSIAMMVKNESKYLESCLKSLQPIRENIKSELIIVDTGSTDHTVEIAKKYTDKVYFHPWNDNFSDMRNKSISYCTGEWVFIIDGDEIVEDSEPLLSFFNKGTYKKYNSASVLIKNYMYDQDDTSYSVLPVIRLFKREKNLKYQGVIHEQPNFKEPLYKLNMQLLHYGYLHTDRVQMERKFKRNVELLEKELKKDPENHYYWFQLSKSHAAYEDYTKALETALTAYEIAKKKDILRSSMYIYVQLALTYVWNSRYKELETLCKEAIKKRDGYIDLYYLLAKAQQELNKNEEAVKNYEIYLNMQKNYAQSSGAKDITLGSYTEGLTEVAYLELTILYERIEKYQKVVEYTAKISTPKILSKAFSQLINAYINLKQYDNIKKYYDELLIRQPELEFDFIANLEQFKGQVSDAEAEIIRIFSEENNPYGILNKIRLKIMGRDEDQEIDQQLIEQIKALDYKNSPVFYGDVIYYLIKKKIDLHGLLEGINDFHWTGYLQYISKKYKDLEERILSYFQTYEDKEDLSDIIISKALKRIVIASDLVKKDEYLRMFDRYIAEGISYIKQVYNEKILDNEMIQVLKNEEEMFFLYMNKALHCKDTDLQKYIQYLRKGLRSFSTAKRGIEMLIEAIEAEVSLQKSQENTVMSEFEAYKMAFKNNINNLIDEQSLREAILLIDEYLKLVPQDMEMLMLKSQLQLKQSY